MDELSIGVQMAWQIAAGEAAAARQQYIEKEHILIGICSLKKVVVHGQNDLRLTKETLLNLQNSYETIENVLHTFKLDSITMRRRIREKLGTGNYERLRRVVHRSDNCKKMFNRAAELARNSKCIYCLHLVAAIMEDAGIIIGSILNDLNVKSDDLRQHALINVANEMRLSIESSQDFSEILNETKTSTPYLDTYGRDLTQEAKEGKLGPFIGRRKELLQLIQTLARRTKNNPVLVGEAGVGKTAIVEALAVQIIQGNESNFLSGKRIIELNIGSIIGGTKYRGDFEQRIKGVIDDAKRNPEIIVFIDEIHTIIGAGRAEGSMDAANLLKPSLARGDLHCIGATTIDEYRKYIESDAALERRFEKIIINEPNPQETLEILKCIKPKLEEHHEVAITEKALEAAVMLSVRFDYDHQLPDKAIDLVDKAGARIRLPVLNRKMEEIVSESKIVESKKKNVVTEFTIVQVLSEKIGLPIEIITGHLDGNENSRLLELELYIKQHLIGQDEVVEKVSQRILMAHSGLKYRIGPLGVFLFLGPTGVGKTELARLLAEFLFGDKSKMIRLDMSEYMEEHSVAKLIGSPPGYIGYAEEGQLTREIRTNPYSVVLLDEIEKAHPRVLDLFLQVFDDGRLTDSKGRTIDTRNAIFIMTSNLTVNNIRETPPIYDARIKVVDPREKLGRFMRPELVNRIDEVLVFGSLNEKDIQKILKPILETAFKDLKKQYEIELTIDDEAESFLIRKGYSQEFGARELKRVVERLVQIPLSRLIISGEIKKHKKWIIRKANGKISIVPDNFEFKDPYKTELL